MMSLSACPAIGWTVSSHIRNADKAGVSRTAVRVGRRLEMLNVKRFRVRSASQEPGSCCGGSDSSNAGAGGGCGSHKSTLAEVAGVGKQFENMLAKSQMQEFEQNYEKGQLEGSISRDVVRDVLDILPDTQPDRTEEKILNIDEILAEARALSQGTFVFESDMEEMIV